MFVFSRDHTHLCIPHPVANIFITSYKGCVIQAEGTVLIQPNLFNKQIDSILKEGLVNKLIFHRGVECQSLWHSIHAASLYQEIPTLMYWNRGGPHSALAMAIMGKMGIQVNMHVLTEFMGWNCMHGGMVV